MIIEANFQSIELHKINIAVDNRGNRFDLSPKFLFNSIQVEAVIKCDEIDSETQMAEATAGTSDTMEICLCILWKIEVDNDIDRLNINPSSKKIRTHQMPCSSIAKLVKHTVAVALKHFCVNVKARVSKLSNFPRKKLDTVHTVAKKDALVDFQFREHSGPFYVLRRRRKIG